MHGQYNATVAKQLFTTSGWSQGNGHGLQNIFGPVQMARRGPTLKPNKARAMGRAVGIVRLYHKKRSNNVSLFIKSTKA